MDVEAEGRTSPLRALALVAALAAALKLLLPATVFLTIFVLLALPVTALIAFLSLRESARAGAGAEREPADDQAPCAPDGWASDAGEDVPAGVDPFDAGSHAPRLPRPIRPD